MIRYQPTKTARHIRLSYDADLTVSREVRYVISSFPHFIHSLYLENNINRGTSEGDHAVEVVIRTTDRLGVAMNTIYISTVSAFKVITILPRRTTFGTDSSNRGAGQPRLPGETL